MSDSLTALTLVTALGCALNGGVFYAFSSFVMAGLRRLAPAEGAAAMQAINVTAVTFAFMLALFGTGALCVAVAAIALANLGEDYAGWLLAGSALYLAGIVVMTMAFHVPRNNALARLDPSGPGADGHWARYLRTWTAGNHVRAAAGVAAAAALMLAAV